MYIRPFTTSRMITVRLPPPVLPGGISGSTSPHSSSVRSLGYRNLLRSQRARFLLVHIGDPSSNQATTLESQVIHMIQVLFGQTLRLCLVNVVSNGIALSGTAHWMFDRGLISLADNLEILISRQTNDPQGVRSIINKSGCALAPRRISDRPHPHFLKWHREHCFKQ